MRLEDIPQHSLLNEDGTVSTLLGPFYWGERDHGFLFRAFIDGRMAIASVPDDRASQNQPTWDTLPPERQRHLEDVAVQHFAQLDRGVF
jgi:hypothetical protein